jgi:chromosome partitioning protein
MIITVASFKGGVGKTTTAVHLAAYLKDFGSVILIDGDPNRSATGWAKRGNLPFEVVDERQAPYRLVNNKPDHIVIDTQARPSEEDLQNLVRGDLLILPTTPDALALDALFQTVMVLKKLDVSKFRILLTIVPPLPRKTGERAKEALAEQGLPLFKHWIRRFACYETAALEGCPVFAVKDRNAGIASQDYQQVGKELL